MFIVIEGIDGTGKSTLARELARVLEGELGTGRVVTTREPTDLSPWGKRLREAATQGRLTREEEIDHFHRDRLHHLDTVIKPALAAGKTVISDRYVNSMLAYQATGPEDAEKLFTRFEAELLTPDIVFILELPVEEALKRIGAGRGGRSQFEMKDTLERARAIYASRKGKRYHRLDATRPLNEVVEAALVVIRALGK